MAVTLMFACNGDRGQFTGHFTAFEVECGDVRMEFRGPWNDEDGPTIEFRFPVSLGPGVVIVDGIEFAAHAYMTWVGNWCWDAVSVSWPEALKIIKHLGTRPEWHMEEGPCDLFDAFDARREITPLEWKNA